MVEITKTVMRMIEIMMLISKIVVMVMIMIVMVMIMVTIETGPAGSAE